MSGTRSRARCSTFSPRTASASRGPSRASSAPSASAPRATGAHAGRCWKWPTSEAESASRLAGGAREVRVPGHVACLIDEQYEQFVAADAHQATDALGSRAEMRPVDHAQDGLARLDQLQVPAPARADTQRPAVENIEFEAAAVAVESAVKVVRAGRGVMSRQ